MSLISFCDRYFVKFDESFLLYSSTVFINEMKYKCKYDNCEQRFKIIYRKQQHLKAYRIRLKKQTRRQLNENILFINDFTKIDNIVIKKEIKSVEKNEIIN